jgi:hypothetical protein
MSTRVIGFRTSNDPIYKKHAAVLRACIDADIEELPKETANYFGTKYPDNYLLEEALQVEIPKTDWSDGDMSEGYEIRVSEIPAGVEIIRFTNSY